MSTVNISLTSDQVTVVNQITKTYDFANRSEFFRALIRLVARKPEVLRAADELVLEPLATRSIPRIIRDMKSTGKYSPAFLKSIEKGLRESGFFTK